LSVLALFHQILSVVLSIVMRFVLTLESRIGIQGVAAAVIPAQIHRISRDVKAAADNL
jgi:Na+-driven multidrug efflux pump